MTPLDQQALAWARTAVSPGITDDATALSLGRNLFTSAATLGLLGIQVPTQYGGLERSFGTKVAVLEALARVDFGAAMALVNTHNVAEQLVRLGRAELSDRYVRRILSGDLVACTALTERGAGSDFAAIQTRAVRTADGWQLDGAKTWIINARYADLVVVYAQTQPASGAAGIAAFLVCGDRSGFVRESDAPLGPIATLGTGGFRLEGYRCTPEEVVSPPGQAFKDILRSINGARVYVAAMCCGMVAECLHAAAVYGQHRQTFGKPLAAHQGWRWALANAAIELEAARQLVRQSAAQIGACDDAQLCAAQAKVFATRMAQTHVAALMHAMGAEGLRDGHPFLRHLHAVQAASLTDGSTEMLLERIARDATTPKTY